MLREKDGTEIDFMYMARIYPASSWFEIVELPVITEVIIPQMPKGTRTKRLINHLN
jgi:hypothetical protein